MPDSIIILSESASFPWGMAASNRVRNLAKGLAMEGWQVEFVSLRGADVLKQQGKRYPAHGTADSIPYHYPSGISVRSGNWWLRRIDDLLGWFCCLFLFVFKKILGRVDAVLLYTSNKNIGGFWIPFLHFLKIPVILEVCEWPLAIAQVKPEQRKRAEKFCYNIVPQADGVLPISGYIEQEINKVCLRQNKQIPSFKIPILIDVEREEKVYNKKESATSPFLLYCGSIAYMDIARMVVDITYELKRINRPIAVLFTGKEDQQGFSKLKEYAKEKGVLELFKFTGFLAEKELHHLMAEAVCLLAPLPENPQSESRFSTKIGYYLASATPVVTNAVGDVSVYLQDGVTAYIADRCSAKEFACSVISILEAETNASKVGRAGRQVALEKFHFTRGCKGLGKFVRKIIYNYRKLECVDLQE